MKANTTGGKTPNTTVLTLGDLEQLAVHGNPTLAQAAAQIEAARGRALQSGLYPNPTVGYQGDEIGVNGTAGFQGVFIDQLIITGGKLRLNRARFQQEVCQMEAVALAQQYRVLNGVRMGFYQLLAMQRQIEVRASLVKIAEEIVKTTEELINVGQANRPDLLQAKVEARQERVALENARARYQAGWQQLAALVGQPHSPVTPLQGNLEAEGGLPDFDTTLAHIFEASPEIQYAHVDVVRNQFALQREQREPVPNVRVRVGTQYNFDSKDQMALAQIGFNLPIFDRNQGNIQVAQAQLARAHAEVQRVELSLRQRLSQAYVRYRTALAVVEEYRKFALPEAREAYELYLDSFTKKRAAYPQVLIAQRNYFQVSVTYVEAMEQLRRAEVAIQGLLLVDGLEEPPGPPGEGGRFQPREQNRSENQFRQDPLGAGGRTLDERLGQNPPP